MTKVRNYSNDEGYFLSEISALEKLIPPTKVSLQLYISSKVGALEKYRFTEEGMPITLPLRQK